MNGILWGVQTPRSYPNRWLRQQAANTGWNESNSHNLYIALYIFIPFAIHVATACRTFWRVLLVYFSLPSILYYALFKRAKSSQDLGSGCLLMDFGVGVKEQVSFYVLLTLRVLESLFHAFNCRCHLGKQLLPNGCCFDGKLVRKRDPGYKVLVTWDVSRDGTFFCRLLLCNIGCQICTRKCWRFLSVLR